MASLIQHDGKHFRMRRGVEVEIPSTLLPSAYRFPGGLVGRSPCRWASVVELPQEEM